MFTQWKLAVIGAILLVCAGEYVYFKHVIGERDKLKAELAVSEFNLKQEKLNAKIVAEASKGFQNELQAIKDRPVPTSPIRLCKQSARPRVQVSPAGTGPDEGSTASGILPEASGGNLEQGPDLRADFNLLMKEAEEVSAQARGLQDYAVRMNEKKHE